jgi:hypothetical protein
MSGKLEKTDCIISTEADSLKIKRLTQKVGKLSSITRIWSNDPWRIIRLIRIS